MGSDDTFYPESAGPPQPRSALPEWMTLLDSAPAPPAPTSPDAYARASRQAPTSPARWLSGMVLAVTLGVIGAIGYASLFVIVGQEVLAAAVVIGVVVGAALRAGGWPQSAVTVLMAAVLACALLLAASAAGHAALEALEGSSGLGSALADEVRRPGRAMAGFVGEPVLAVIALGLTAAGAAVAAATYRSR